MVRLWKKVSLLPVFLLLASHAFAALLAIDYGQQFIKAMVVSPQAPLEMVLTPEAKRKEVSGLAFKKLRGKSKDIERFYGSAVGSLSTRFPQNSLLHLKPLLGRSIDSPEVAKYMEEHPGLKLIGTDRKSIAVEIDNVEYSIEELVGMNLQEIAARGNKHIKDNDRRSKDFVEKVAISVPGFFDQYQRFAYMDAGLFIHDINGLTLIDDGLSIAINFATKKNDFEVNVPHHYIIYDMGSGSIKASLVTIIQDEDKDIPINIELQGYGFNSTLGGSSLTMKVAGIIQQKFLEQNSKISKEALQADPRAMAKIIQAAEKAKLVLSANSESSVSIESLVSDIDFRTSITREDFEKSLEEFAESFSKPLLDAINKQFTDGEEKIGLDDIKGIILAGGSSRVPFVQKSLAKIVDSTRLLKNVNADESVVNGETLRGVQLFKLFKTRPFNVTDRSVFNFTLSQIDESNKSDIPIFKAGDIFPTKKTILVPTEDASKESHFSIYENDQIIKNLTIHGIKNFTTTECPFGSVYSMTYAFTRVRTMSFDTINCVCLNSEEEAKNVRKEIEGTSVEIELDEDEEFEEFDNDSNTLTTFSFDEDARKQDGSMISPQTSMSDDNIKPMSNIERQESSNRIKEFDENDKRRFQLQEAKNLLESTLYDARNFLNEDSLMNDGPQSQLEKLAKLVTEYLEWLEEEADQANKSQINRKRKEVSQMKIKIEEYMLSIDEPVGFEQFQNMLEKADGLLTKIGENSEHLERRFLKLESKVDEKILNVREEYLKIKVPSYLSDTLVNYNTSVNKLNESFSKLSQFIETDIFETLNREQLYELKTEFYDLEKDVSEKFAALEAIQDQRFSELKSLYQRKLRAIKRKEKKKSQSLESEQVKSSTVVSSETTIPDESSTSTKAEPTAEHDEL